MMWSNLKVDFVCYREMIQISDFIVLLYWETVNLKKKTPTGYMGNISDI